MLKINIPILYPQTVKHDDGTIKFSSMFNIYSIKTHIEYIKINYNVSTTWLFIQYFNKSKKKHFDFTIIQK